MGNSSQARSTNSKQMVARKAKAKGDGKQKQTTITGKKPPVSQDSNSWAPMLDKPGYFQDPHGMIKTCNKCLNKSSHKSHADYCPQSKYYKMSKAEKEAAKRTQRDAKATKASFKTSGLPAKGQGAKASHEFFRAKPKKSKTTPKLPSPRKNSPSNALMDSPKKPPTTRLAATAAADDAVAAAAGGGDTQGSDSGMAKLLDLTPSNLKAIIKTRLAAGFSNCSELQLSKPLFAVVEHISSCTPSLRGASNDIIQSDRSPVNTAKAYWWNQNFKPGNISFTIPRDDCGDTADPNYHSIEGITIYWVRWELAFPGKKFLCFEVDCEGELIHCSKQKTQKASHYICDASGSRFLAFTINYQCNKCGTICSGTDGQFLHTLPSYASLQFPVEEKCASSAKLQLHHSLTRMFASLGITHVSAEALAGQVREALGQAYIDATADYYSRPSRESPNYPSFLDWSNNAPTPTGKLLLDSFRQGFLSGLTLSGISDYERCTREIQGVGSKATYCHDHHFAFVKNYSGLARRSTQAAFTAMTDSGEVACVALVPTTKISDAAHAIEQMARRLGFNPKGYWTDTYPDNKELMAELLGEDVQGHLGVFHFVQRIVDTLKPGHVDYR